MNTVVACQFRKKRTFVEFTAEIHDQFRLICRSFPSLLTAQSCPSTRPMKTNELGWFFPHFHNLGLLGISYSSAPVVVAIVLKGRKES